MSISTYQGCVTKNKRKKKKENSAWFFLYSTGYLYQLPNNNTVCTQPNISWVGLVEFGLGKRKKWRVELVKIRNTPLSDLV
jgi:hypothetical protein